MNLAKSKNIRIACVGNSSSGIKETAVFGCPTVNIGTRQKSNLRGSNVLDVNYAHKEIYNGIKNVYMMIDLEVKPFILITLRYR